MRRATYTRDDAQRAWARRRADLDDSDAVAAAVITFAFDTSTVNGVRVPGKSHGAGNSADAFHNRATA